MIKTKNFELAFYAKGNENSDKLALVLPGRLDTKDYISCTSLVDMLSQNGYYAISLDVPGTWESPGDFSQYTTTTYIKVVNELIEHFGNKPTLLAGHSRGGAVAILCSENPHVEAVVAIMASYGEPSSPSQEDLDFGAHVSYRDLPPGDKVSKEQKRFEMPLVYFEDGKQYSALETLKTCQKPKLLINGTRDEFTPMPLFEKVFVSAAEPKVKKVFDSDHDYRRHSNIVDEVNRTVSEFIKEY